MRSPEERTVPWTYLGYTPEGLAAQYNLRAAVPDHPERFARWETRSAAARESLPHDRDLVYGPLDRQRIDFFPARRPGAPVLAFVHGGYWQALSKDFVSYLAPAFVDAGISFAAIGYTLCPQVSVPGLIDEVRSALGWLHDHLQPLGGDAGRIFVAGHSAGGHLAAAVAATAWAARGQPPDLVKGVCAISGVYDMEPVRRTYLNDALNLDVATAHAVSPIHMAQPVAVPIICAIGERETTEFRRQQAAFVDICRTHGRPASTVALPDRDHFDAVDALGEPDHPLFRAVRDMILDR